MSKRIFADRLNAELDEIGMPLNQEERAESLAKLLDLPKFKAQAMLNGLDLTDDQTLITLAELLELSGDWLLGKD